MDLEPGRFSKTSIGFEVKGPEGILSSGLTTVVKMGTILLVGELITCLEDSLAQSGHLLALAVVSPLSLGVGKAELPGMLWSAGQGLLVPVRP